MMISYKCRIGIDLTKEKCRNKQEMVTDKIQSEILQ